MLLKRLSDFVYVTLRLLLNDNRQQKKAITTMIHGDCK